jgi:hypothetical protein
VKSKLFIVVSTLFGRQVERASGDRTYDIGKDEVLFSLNDRERPSDKPVSGDRLTSLLVNGVKSNPADNVWIILHMGCCVELLNPDEQRVQVRLPKGESVLRDALVAAGISAPQCLEVHGFHHEEIAPVWKVLQEFKVPVPDGFSQDLVRALRVAERDTLFKRFTVVKHRIVGLFLPLDLTLQNWAETGDPGLRKRIDEALESKVAEARKLLDTAQEIVQSSGKSASLASLDAHLRIEAARDAAQGALTFHNWINQLDQTLDELRKGTIE